MTKDELIRALANTDDEDKVRQLLVDFVAEWIGKTDPTMDENWMAEVWREEMA